MKTIIKTFCLLVFVAVTTKAYAQTLTNGNYTSADGYYTVSVVHQNNEITLTEPNKVNVYQNAGNNMYYHTEPKYADYYLKIAGTQQYYTGKNGGTEYLFTFSGSNTLQDDLAAGIDNCPLYDKYENLASEDELNAQVWTFCGAAALVKCTYNEEGASKYIKDVIVTLKLIMTDPSTCPCTDVISQAVWNAN